ncbi:hypothetical protein BV898_08271 [Hypsibius exemplaris]|uniref:Uncharacterized protein n=1 Tax=Hypsibius exemplaris TaxID=2072580 RepID=A0A1W0WR60_HYPEX|nr:hypothetical protein BV898_08271 [Hypsibius exemplaris]
MKVSSATIGARVHDATSSVWAVATVMLVLGFKGCYVGQRLSKTTTGIHIEPEIYTPQALVEHDYVIPWITHILHKRGMTGHVDSQEV